MKKSILTLICCLFLMATQAQEWQPVRVGWVYTYRAYVESEAIGPIYNGATHLHNIWIDSLYENLGDTVFVFNQMIANGQPDVSGFLESKMQKKANGDYLFMTPDTFLMKPHAELGHSWSWSDTDTATVVFVGVDTILGVLDSIKTWTLTSGDTVQISKQLGIVKFPSGVSGFFDTHYKLIGMETDSLHVGFKLPKFWEIFDFSEGDIFMYREEFATWYSSHRYWKMTINNKQVLPDGYRYEVRLIKSLLCDFFGCMLPSPTDPKTPLKNVCHPSFVNMYSDTVMHLKVSDFLFLFNNSKSFAHGMRTVYYDTHYSPPHEIGQNHNFCASSTFARGIGLTQYFASGSNGTILRLLGFVRDGDTTGIVHSDSFVLATESIQNTSPTTFNAFIHPNPSFGSTYLSFQNAPQTMVSVEIYNLQGQLLQQQELAAGLTQYEIAVNQLPSGLYLIRLADSTGNKQLLKWVLH